MTAAPPRAEPAWRAVLDPRVAAAAVAVVVRATFALQAFAHGIAAARLDGIVYLNWAGDIAAGDILGRAGTIHGEPFLFNPLYAYALAPIVGVFGKSPAAVVVVQTLLAGATAALAADAARRFAGRTAAWVAGLATAFSAALVHLDAKVAVSGLAAFVIAGATWALSPEDGDVPRRRGHGPLAAGLWLGASLLARPVTLVALPLVAWLVVRAQPQKVRSISLFLLPVAACASLSFARNVAVSGERVVFTAADGQNLHLGNNAAARRSGAMTSDEFEFSPTSMHDDARYRVAFELRREPTRSEISSWFAGLALRDFAAAPGASLAWLSTKLRWFAGPKELSSSYDIEFDQRVAPSLGLAFVPTWTLIALAAAAAFVSRRRADLLLGPGAIVLAHAAACTLAYPLSHYRSPCVPAAAVMSGVCVAGFVEAWRSRGSLAAGVALVVATAVAVVGFLPPQARTFPGAILSQDASAALERGDVAAADDLARRALELGPDDTAALAVRLSAASKEDRFEDERAFAARLVALRPWNPHPRLDVAYCDARLGRKDDARRESDEVVAMFPWSAEVVGWRGKIRVLNGDVEGAKADLRWAMDRGFVAPEWALRRAGL